MKIERETVEGALEILAALSRQPELLEQLAEREPTVVDQKRLLEISIDLSDAIEGLELEAN